MGIHTHRDGYDSYRGVPCHTWTIFGNLKFLHLMTIGVLANRFWKIKINSENNLKT